MTRARILAAVAGGVLSLAVVGMVALSTPYRYAVGPCDALAAYGLTVDAAQGLPRAGVPAAPYPLGWTLHYSDPIPHPTTPGLCRYELPPTYPTLPDGLQGVDVLTPDWRPAPAPMFPGVPGGVP